MWWWRKVRRANISQGLRDELERWGETVVVSALVLAPAMPSSPLHSLATVHRNDTLEWLTERRDLTERREQRLETFEIGVLVFVVLGVVLDFLRWFRC